MRSQTKSSALTVAVIGGGAAGLMAAEVLSKHGFAVDIYDAMSSVGRKFLLAGKGGMNITHSEEQNLFLSRYGQQRVFLEPMLHAFGASDVRQWMTGLGFDSFVGTSGRVFPTDMKAAPLLRAWLHRLREAGVKIHVRHKWTGWNTQGALTFATPESEKIVHADAVVLALGGGSWPRLGSNGAWVSILEQQGVAVARLQAANCGFDSAWSEHFSSRFAGQPLKSAFVSFTNAQGQYHRQQGDFVVTLTGIEGSLIYALSRDLRETINAQGSVTCYLDLLAHKSAQQIEAALSKPRGSASFSSHLRKQLNLDGVKAGLLRECLSPEVFNYPQQLSLAIKSLPITLLAPRPIVEAISSAGGISFDALNADLMLHQLPNVFCAGEMLDWEAPTGGYLLTACFASGRHAALGVIKRLTQS
ncbi:MAG: TIGR03862 family flavoprotein [Agitococcus sp.]|nr:TIGR03862 family flavoprotein [Agitococcus sp.]